MTTSNIPESLGERLRARRHSLDLTIAEVAERAGLSLPYVSNLERGRGNPTLEVLTNLAEVLGIPVSQLVGTESTEGQVSSDELRLASLPTSLARFSRSQDFLREVRNLADQKDESFEEMRQRVLLAMAAAPRRSNGEPTSSDWQRLLDAYTLILRS
jgi:transcriptional regulator with XRE-family HTH domain